MTSLDLDRDAVSILDANRNQGTAPGLTGADQELFQRRQGVLGSVAPLMYETPVHIVEGRGAWLTDAEGRRYLDMYNNVASVGHCNPRVVDAITRQAARLNTHTRYLHENVVAYGERLLALSDIPDPRLVLTCTGSEANDMALRAVRRLTGQQGVIVSEAAYHGNTAIVSAVSPSTNVPAEWVEVVPPPDPNRAGGADLASWWAGEVVAAADRLHHRGFGLAALLVDAVFSSDGIHPSPTGALGAASDAVHARGGYVIADEVQPGFGRLGENMWGHTAAGLRPDFLTTGKPMGNGMPIAALIGRKALLDAFLPEENYFNTFAGNPVTVAAASAVLDEIEESGLIDRAATMGASLLDGIRSVAATNTRVSAVRGKGLYVGVDICDADGRPDRAGASVVVNGLRERGVLLSVAGENASTLKVRPPLVVGSAEIERFTTELSAVLADLERR